MRMKKRTAFWVMIVALLVCIAASGFWAVGQIPVWIAEVLLVVAFPVFVLSLGLWWMASEGKEDIPFIGY
jgi:hypothetical protein